MNLTKNQKRILRKILEEGPYNESKQNGEFTYGSPYDYASLKEKGLIDFSAIEQNGELLSIDVIRLTVKGREYISQSFFDKSWNWLKNNKLITAVILERILDYMFK